MRHGHVSMITAVCNTIADTNELCRFHKSLIDVLFLNFLEVNVGIFES